MKSLRKKCVIDSCPGFSLVEFIMVIVVLGIIAATGAQMMGMGFKAYFTGKDITEMDWQARVALERMTRELRGVFCTQVNLTQCTPAVTLSPANEITFVDGSGNSIRYCMGTIGTCPGAVGELTRNTQPLASGVSNLTFSYLDKTGATTATAAQVYYIVVNFTATQNGLSKAYQATVGPRNFL